MGTGIAILSERIQYLKFDGRLRLICRIVRHRLVSLCGSTETGPPSARLTREEPSPRAGKRTSCGSRRLCCQPRPEIGTADGNLPDCRASGQDCRTAARRPAKSKAGLIIMPYRWRKRLLKGRRRFSRNAFRKYRSVSRRDGFDAVVGWPRQLFGPCTGGARRPSLYARPST